jgi:hypothetical protein
MKTNFKLTDPTYEIVKNMVPSSGSGNYRSVMVVQIPINTTSQAAAATNWVNPEAGTVCARPFLLMQTTGTGTVDIGRGSDGTGTETDLIDGGTLTVGAHYAQEILGTVAASAVKGGVDRLWVLLGPGGTGTNNSINMTHTDTVTSTMVGSLCIEYFLMLA